MSEVTLPNRSFEEFELRMVEPADFNKGILKVLAQMTTVGKVDEAMFAAALKDKERAWVHTVVVEDKSSSTIVGTAALQVEPKFIHSCSRVGHIEDVVVADTHRSRKLGMRLIDALQDIAIQEKCYKVILDCTEDNQGFYEKQGFFRKEVQMRYNIDSSLG
eukprot:gene15424-23582_t